MRGQYRGRVILFGLFLLVFTLLLTTFAFSLTQANLTYVNGTLAHHFSYDRINSAYSGSAYGSDSYMDESPTNQNVILELCHPQLKIGDYVDLVYSTINRQFLASTLNFLPWVTSVDTYPGTPAYNCTTLDIDYSALKALYPGYTLPLLLYNGSSPDYSAYNTSGNDSYLYPVTPLLFDGDYDIGVDIIGPPKTYLFSVAQIYDENNIPITTYRDSLLTSLVNSSNNNTLAYAQLTPRQTFYYQGNLEGQERMYVNDKLALELTLYNPCDPINESGYYIMNFSLFDYNESCVVINRTDDVVLNFGGELLDGDVQNQSPTDPDYNVTCSVTIKDSQNITLENFFVQNFYWGLCVENSSVLVYGTGALDNINGAKIYGGSTVRMVDMDFANNESEIQAFAGGEVQLTEVNLSTAVLSSTFYDTTVRGVNIRPPEPFQLGWSDELFTIEQFIEYERNSDDSYAQITFHYTEPLPNGVVTNNVSIYEYNGTFYDTNISGANGTIYEAGTWSGGNWTQVFTLVSPSERVLIGPNLSDFSVFAPFGYSTISRGEEEPGDGDEAGTVPEPDPDPDPEAGSTSGGGGTPARTEFRDILEVGPLKPLLIELNILENVTLMQGEAGEIPYNVTNQGDGVPEILTIGPQVDEGWEYTNSSIYELDVFETQNNSFMLAPYEKAKPGMYNVPVHVYLPTVNGEVTIVKEILRVLVTPRGDLKRLRITEYPPEIIIPAFSEQDITFQAKNIGDAPLENIEIRLGEDGSECILDVLGMNKVKINEEKSLTYTFKFGEQAQCQENIKFYDGEELIGFAPISIIIEDKFTKEEVVKLSIMVVVTLAWTALTIRIISRRRRKIA